MFQKFGTEVSVILEADFLEASGLSEKECLQ